MSDRKSRSRIQSSRASKAGRSLDLRLEPAIVEEIRKLAKERHHTFNQQVVETVEAALRLRKKAADQDSTPAPEIKPGGKIVYLAFDQKGYELVECLAGIKEKGIPETIEEVLWNFYAMLVHLPTDRLNEPDLFGFRDFLRDTEAGKAFGL